jgi:WD40 repeat protein
VAAVSSQSLVSGSDDHNLIQWYRTNDGWELVRQWSGSSLWISALLRTSTQLLSGDGAGKLHIWSLPVDLEQNATALAAEVKPSQTLLGGHRDCVWAVNSYEWNHEAKLLCSSSADKTVRIWARGLDDCCRTTSAAPTAEGWNCALIMRSPHLRRSVAHALTFLSGDVPAICGGGAEWGPDTEVAVYSHLKVATGGSDGVVALFQLTFEYDEYGTAWWDYSLLSTIDPIGPNPGGTITQVEQLPGHEGLIVCGKQGLCLLYWSDIGVSPYTYI